ncbi:MAG: quinoprotein glucose dehydrogenase [Ignavibacteriae bacterium HGW-Ignavibacteriae-4]|jgi:glucose/arabinose dehydrogenase|nr:MAG: quinoprotein glucose dehydrogenase [Ignavibacteriae bacterium HGW-Ignavibacteriae-4]
MRKAISTTLLGMIASIFLLFSWSSESRAQEYNYRDAATGLNTIWEIIWGPDDYLWVTERQGRVQRINPETGEMQQVLDITSDVITGSERGLMGMALSPTFSDDGFVYLSYTYQSGGTIVKIVRYRYNGTELIEPTTLLDNIQGASNHDGCRLAFGPDGMLYITTGDAQNTSLAQNLTSLNGKVLRINPDGSIPDDNPYYGNKSLKNEIWSNGHRNPQGLVFHNGILYSSEHGPNTNDELNIIEKERNYGWPDVEGMCNDPIEIEYCESHNIKEPLAIYYQSSTLAVAGIAFYDISGDAQFKMPEIQNSILMTTLRTGILMQIKLSEDGMEVLEEKNIVNNTYGRLRAVCVSPDGRVFFGTSNRDGRGQPGFPDNDKIVEITPVKTNVESKDKGSSFEVFPNPSYGHLNIKSTSNSVSRVSIFDMLGNKMTEIALDPYSNHYLQTSDIVSGNYHLRIESNGQIENKIVNIIH